MNFLTLTYIIAGIIIFLIFLFRFLLNKNKSLEPKTKKYIKKKKKKENLTRYGIKKSQFKGSCIICDSNIEGFDAFCCNYCGKWHCPTHRLPESHDCTGEPKNPGGSYKVSYSNGNTIVTGK